MARSLGIPAVVGLHDATEKLEIGRRSSARWLQWLAHPQSDAGDALALWRTQAPQGTGRRATDRSARDEIDDARRAAHCAFGEHRAAERRRFRRGEWRRRDRTLPHGVSLSEPADVADGGGAIRDLPRSRSERRAASVDHPHVRSGRRQDRDAGWRRDDEQNPFMGLRAIRFCLENLDIFKAQLRAILRASAARAISRSCSR